jgi:hypothetical protein
MTGDLIRYLPLLVAYAETPALDEWERDPREWIDLLRNESETDGVFLALRFAAMNASSFVREAIYDSLSPLRGHALPQCRNAESG